MNAVAVKQSGKVTKAPAGVPQGSILGPLLFNIFINDMLDHTKSCGVLFADDSSLFAVIDKRESRDTVARSLCDDLASLSRWAEQWQVVFNGDKFPLLTISRKNDCSLNGPVFYGGMPIVESEALKILGVTITKTMDWSNH